MCGNEVHGPERLGSSSAANSEIPIVAVTTNVIISRDGPARGTVSCTKNQSQTRQAEPPGPSKYSG